MKTQYPITAIVLTLNEEKNIERCLSSLAFVDEILVCDSGSIDNTENMVSLYPNAIFRKIQWKGYAQTKQEALEIAKNNWIIWLDADEKITKKSRKEIVEEVIINKYDILKIPRQTYFIDSFMYYGGWYPDYQMRIFKKDKARFDDSMVHESIVPVEGAAIKELYFPLKHYSFYTVDQYKAKQKKYAQLFAEDLIKRNKKPSFFKRFLSPVWAWLQSFIFKFGFLEGKNGLTIANGAAQYTYWKYQLYFEKKK